MTPPLLPTLNALLNASALVLLLFGRRFIRRGDVARHRACMLSAVVVSAVFLVTYSIHHAQVGSVRFQGTGLFRAIYFGVLIPHVLLAAALVPLVLLTLWRALAGRFEAHRAMARITWPTWLIVSVSGVVVYLMLYRPGF